MSRGIYTNCRNCGKELTLKQIRKNRSYCNNDCHNEFRHSKSEVPTEEETLELLRLLKKK